MTAILTIIPTVLLATQGCVTHHSGRTAESVQLEWPAVDTGAALRALDEAGEVGSSNHMPHSHYFSVPIPFYAGHPAYPSAAERLDRASLVAALRSDDKARNATLAWEKIVRVGSEAVPQLIMALESDDPQQMILASAALGRIGGQTAVAALIREFKDDARPHNALAAYLALAGIGREAVPQLREAARSPDRQQRVFAGCLLSGLEKRETDFKHR